MEKLNINIKGENITLIIKSYDTSKSIKLFVKGDELVITKPKYISQKKILQYIEENKEKIYEIYINDKGNNVYQKKWIDGETILFNGEWYKIKRQFGKKVEVDIDTQDKILSIFIPHDLKEEEIKSRVDKCVIDTFKFITTSIVTIRLMYWSKITGIKYETVKIRDMVSRYGSCIASKKSLNFSSRLAMFNIETIDAIIVHELCHIVYTNHNSNFYSLVNKYITNYTRNR